MNMDKDIENVKEIINNNYLEDLGYLREENDYIIFNQSMSNVLSELETYKKIAEKLASVIDSCCDGENTNTDKYIKKYCKFEELQCLRKKEINCKQCIIDWAKREVSKDE